MSKITAAITAVGGYVPEDVMTNQMLEKIVDTNDEWITTRTGIKERRILKKEGEGTSYLAIKAVEDLLSKRDLDPAEIDVVLVATATPDMMVASQLPMLPQRSEQSMLLLMIYRLLVLAFCMG